MNKEEFVTGHFYHVFNRGVDKRTLFLEDRDYERFLIALFLFNDSQIHDYDLTRIKLRGLTSYNIKGEKLVDILHWCLMPNHFHLLLRQNIDRGVSIFMQKVGTSYTMFFNKKHERSGRLFQGTYRAKSVLEDEYFSHLASYIPLNALDLYFPKWKEKGISQEKLLKAKELLLSYKWSSYPDYFGQSSVPGLVTSSEFYQVFGVSKDKKDKYEKLIDSILTRGVPQPLRG